MTDPSRGGLLYTEDVARIWSDELGIEIKVDRVYDYYKWSKPTRPGVKTHNRYEDFPMPFAEATRRPQRAGRRAVQPSWYADQEQDLRAWIHERLNPGTHGAAGKRRKAVWDEKFVDTR